MCCDPREFLHLMLVFGLGREPDDEAIFTLRAPRPCGHPVLPHRPGRAHAQRERRASGSRVCLSWPHSGSRSVRRRSATSWCQDTPGRSPRRGELLSRFSVAMAPVQAIPRGLGHCPMSIGPARRSRSHRAARSDTCLGCAAVIPCQAVGRTLIDPAETSVPISEIPLPDLLTNKAVVPRHAAKRRQNRSTV